MQATRTTRSAARLQLAPGVRLYRRGPLDKPEVAPSWELHLAPTGDQRRPSREYLGSLDRAAASLMPSMVLNALQNVDVESFDDDLARGELESFLTQMRSRRPAYAGELELAARRASAILTASRDHLRDRQCSEDADVRAGILTLPHHAAQRLLSGRECTLLTLPMTGPARWRKPIIDCMREELAAPDPIWHEFRGGEILLRHQVSAERDKTLRPLRDYIDQATTIWLDDGDIVNRAARQLLNAALARIRFELLQEASRPQLQTRGLILGGAFATLPESRFYRLVEVRVERSARHSGALVLLDPELDTSLSGSVWETVWAIESPRTRLADATSIDND